MVYGKSQTSGITFMTEKTQYIDEAHNSGLRQDHEPPAVTKQGWRYHHVGIPTDKPLSKEDYSPKYKMTASGYYQSQYGIEWMRFEQGSPISELVRTVPHIAFEVNDLDKEIQWKKLLGEVSNHSEGVRVAMIIDNGAPVELIEFSKKKRFRRNRKK